MRVNSMLRYCPTLAQFHLDHLLYNPITHQMKRECAPNFAICTNFARVAEIVSVQVTISNFKIKLHIVHNSKKYVTVLKLKSLESNATNISSIGDL